MQLVFICGGRGTRLGERKPSGVPKSMIALGAEPLVGRLMRQLLPYHAASAPPVFVVAGDDEHVARFARARCPGAAIVRQAAPDGVANAMLCARHLVRGPALVVLGDLVLDGRLVEPWPPAPALAVWSGGDAASVRRNYGVRLRGELVEELAEKPPDPGDLACGLGLYLLTPEVLDLFALAPIDPSRNEREITEALRFAMRRGVRFSALRFEGRYININTPADLDAARALDGAAAAPRG